MMRSLQVARKKHTEDVTALEEALARPVGPLYYERPIKRRRTHPTSATTLEPSEPMDVVADLMSDLVDDHDGGLDHHHDNDQVLEVDATSTGTHERARR